MSYIITAYSKTAYQDFLLPAEKDADASVTFYKDIFGLKKDVTVRLEVIDGKWHFRPSVLYGVFLNGRNYFNRELENQDILDLHLSDGSVISLIVWENQQSFSVFTKLDISHVSGITVGKSSRADISFDVMGLISRDHMVLSLRNGTCLLTDNSRNGVYVNSFRVNGTQQLNYGDEINLFGLKMIWLGRILAVRWNHVPVEIHQPAIQAISSYRLPQYSSKPPYPGISSDQNTGSEGTLFQRSPRNLTRLETEPVAIDQPPQKERENQNPFLMTVGPSLTMAIPMILGSGLAILGSSGSGLAGSVFLYTGLVTAVASAAIGALWSAFSWKSMRKMSEEREEKRRSTYGLYLEQTEKKIAGRYDYNRKLLENMYPSAASMTQYTEQTIRLWNRNPSQSDFLSERLGIGTVPFQVPIEVEKQHFSADHDALADRPEEIKRKYKNLENVPVCIDLAKHGLIGVVGGTSGRGAYQVARILMTQIAANNSYTDVKMGLVCSRDSGAEKELLEDAKWFPHFWSETKRTRYTADNPTDAANVFFEIADLVRRRAEESRDYESEKKMPVPHIVLFLTNPENLDGELLSKYVLDPKPEYGLTTVLLVSEYEELPNSCNFIIKNDEGFQGYYSNSEGLENRPVHLHFDDVSRDAFRAFARRLSNIRVRENLKSGDIPASVSFLDMYHAGSLSDLNVRSRWAKNRNWESMRALIGVAGGERPCFLDIHEKYHGPHGLIAGTTGSGKSETLQTFILSLAVNFSPEDVAFFIIDYKGGGMGGLFTRLPHLAGQVSNLSGNQVRRAMISIKSENQRRQRLFQRYGVNHIDQYTRLYKNKEAADPIPHLLIIIDEFAELKREEPEFMQELISVAQVGRSLGVHLILSTQRPAGTVDDNIWSNSKFRLCLRVQDRQDSMDMLHKPDAAYITQTGRGYLQVGNDELYELFQSGWSGAPYEENPDDAGNLVKLLSIDGRPVFTGKRSRIRKEEKEKKKMTQLEAVTEYLFEMAASCGYQSDFSIWKPVLPEKLYLKTEGTPLWPRHKSWSLSAEAGLVDDPAHQAQFPLTVDLAKDGHTAVFGTVSCGKSTFLQTLTASFIRKYDPSRLNIYLIDFSSHMLDSFADAPHTGGVMNEDTPDRIRNFFRMVSGMLKERRRILKGGNYEQYVRNSGITMPAVLIVLDQYVSFREKTDEAYTEILTRIAREGTNFGIYLILTAPGSGFGGLDRKIGDSINHVICLELKDKYEYNEALHTMKTEILPEPGIRGRGLVKKDGSVLEFQTALALPAENDYERGEKLSRFAKKMSGMWQGKPAVKIPEIPADPTAEDFFSSDEVKSALERPELLPCGYRSEDASVYSLPLSKIFCFLITGEARSGKSNFLRIALRSASYKHARLYVFDRTGSFAKDAADTGATVLSGSQDIYDTMTKLIPEFSRRHKFRQNLVTEGMEEEEIFEQMKDFQPIIFFIDDLNAFLEAVEEPPLDVPDMTGFFENMTEKGQMHGIYFLAAIPAGNSSPLGSTIFQNMTRDKKGIRFGGNAGSDRILSFGYLSYSEQGRKMKKGTGLLSDGNEDEDGHSVVIPYAKR